MSDKYFAYCPEAGYETFKTEQEAVDYANESIEHYSELSADYGWDENVNYVSWGEIKQRATMCDIKTYDQCVKEGLNLSQEFDYHCDYKLKDVK